MYYVLVTRQGLTTTLTIETHNQEGIPSHTATREVYGPIPDMETALCVRADLYDSIQKFTQRAVDDIKQHLVTLDP